MKTTLALGIAASMFVAGVWSIGCSSSSDNGGGGTTDDGGTTATDGSTVHKDGGGTTSDAGETTDSGTTTDSGGAAPCATECATSLCAATPKGPMQGDACDTCLNTVLAGPMMPGVCYASVNTACTGNADCQAYLMCGNACPDDGGTAGNAPDGSTDMTCDMYNADSCIGCCQQNHLSGIRALDMAIIQCACQGP